MSKYSLWEANRKVFLFPENWIEPAFRDDKSPAFATFESSLLKSSLTRENVKGALLNYIHDMYQVRSLFIEAIYTQRSPTIDGQYGSPEVIHYFGRTFTTPYIFYHRTFTQNAGIWTPWRKVDTQITIITHCADGSLVGRPGAYVIPYIFQNRLMLILPELAVISVKGDKQQSATASIDDETITFETPKDSGVSKYWQIKLAWTEFRNNKWLPKTVCQSALDYKRTELCDIDVFRFLVGLPDELLNKEDQIIASALKKAAGDETFSIWVDQGSTEHVGAFAWLNGGFEVLSGIDIDNQMRRRDGRDFDITSFHKQDIHSTFSLFWNQAFSLGPLWCPLNLMSVT